MFKKSRPPVRIRFLGARSSKAAGPWAGSAYATVREHGNGPRTPLAGFFNILKTMSQLYGKPLITQEAMRARVRELGKDISRDYQDKDLIMIGILKGAFTFFADLARAIRLPLQMDFLIVKSQKAKGGPSGKVKVLSDLNEEIKGRHVLIVEDIVDSGLTVEQLMKRLRKKKPASLEVCTLLSKTVRRQVQVKVQYVGFEIPDHYVVGYGMDYQQKYRNLPYLAVLAPDLREPS